MAQVTREQVQKAYEALATGDKEKCRQYWADDMRWLAPGHNQVSGWYEGLDGFLSASNRDRIGMRGSARG